MSQHDDLMARLHYCGTCGVPICHKAADAIVALVVERDALRADAERQARTVQAIVNWIETHQRDAFKRGLWDAIDAARAAQEQ